MTQVINKKANGNRKEVTTIVGLNQTDMKRAKALYAKGNKSAATMRRDHAELGGLFDKAKATFPSKPAFGKWLRDNFPGINVAMVSKQRLMHLHFEAIETWLLNEAQKPSWTHPQNIVTGYVRWAKANDPKAGIFSDMEKTTNGKPASKGNTADGDRDNDAELSVDDCIGKVGSEVNRLIKKVNKKGITGEQQANLRRVLENALAQLCESESIDKAA